jgi:CspA family cold shock protein
LNKGTVTRYSDDKGFGFIKKDDGREVYFDRAAVDKEGYIILVGGDRVEFEATETPRGLEATNVSKIEHSDN